MYCRVVELGSFARTAQDQNVSPAIVGRHIDNLEKSLGVRLINRTTRTMEVTSAGKRYYEGCKRLIAQVESLEQSVVEDPTILPSGIIKVAAPEGLGTPLLLNTIETFQDLYPDISVDLLLENTPTDIVGENVDIAVRLATVLEDSSLIVRKVCDTRLPLLASPRYIEHKGMPKSINDLRNHDCLHFSTARYGGNWPYLAGGKIRKFNADWKFVTNHTATFLNAIVHGVGIGLSPMIMARPFVQSGELQIVEIEEDFPDVSVFLVLPYRDLVPKRVSLFADHLTHQIKQNTEANGIH